MKIAFTTSDVLTAALMKFKIFLNATSCVVAKL